VFVLSLQPQPERAYLRVHHGLPHRAVSAAHLRAVLQADDPPLHGDGHQVLRHVSGGRGQRVSTSPLLVITPPTTVNPVWATLSLTPWPRLLSAPAHPAQVRRLRLSVGGPQRGVLLGRPLRGGHRGPPALQGEAAQAAGRLQHGRHRVPGGHQGTGGEQEMERRMDGMGGLMDGWRGRGDG